MIQWVLEVDMWNSIGLRDDYGAKDLRALARKSRHVAQSRRLLALAAVYDGMSRTEAARVGGMDRQTLRDWVHRFNEEGPDGVEDRPRSGKPSRLTPDQLKELAAIVEAGPDPDVDGVVRWRCCDLVDVVEARFGVVYAERSLSTILKKLGFSRMSARPRHPGQSAEGIAAFKKTSHP